MIALRLRVPCSTMGSVSWPAGSNWTPIFMRGAVMRRMGRRLSESSPVSSTSMSHGASTPMSRRAVVPELPQSMGASGWLGPCAPQPVTVPASEPSGCSSSWTSAPSARTAAMDERTSWESRTPEMCDVPSAIALKSTARCEIDLSPGTRAVPESGPLSGLMVTTSFDMSMLLRHQRAERYGEPGVDELGGKLADVPLVGEDEGEHRVAFA